MSVVSQGLTKGWGNINFNSVAIDGVFGMINGAMTVSKLTSPLITVGLNFTIGFGGSMAGDMIANNGDLGKVNWRKAFMMGATSAITASAGAKGLNSLNRRAAVNPKYISALGDDFIMRSTEQAQALSRLFDINALAILAGGSISAGAIGVVLNKLFGKR